MKFVTRAAVGAVLLFGWATAASGQDKPGRKGDAAQARAYLAEVKKHVVESFINREKIREDEVERAGVAALREAAGRPDWGVAAEEDRIEIAEALKGKETVEAAVNAVAAVARAKNLPVEWLRFSDAAARAMVKKTGDPFSRILTGEDFNKLVRMMQGGSREDSIGLAVQLEGEKVVVAYVQFGYIAFEEGVEIGDEILEIGGKPVAGRTPVDLNESLKVTPGRTLNLKIRREGHGSPYEFTLVQRRPRVKDVHFEMLGSGVGYLRMTVFDLGLVREVRKALQKMKDEGMKSLILDLRHNPGGALPAATAVADLFLDQDLLITKTEMHYKPAILGFQLPGFGGDQEYRTKSRTDFEDLPLCVLVDHASASASELFAGALQDHKRGRVIGETTYGKGVGQTAIPLMSTAAGFMPDRFLYLTVLRYFLPSGRSIDHKGVVPDHAFAGKPIPAERFAEIWRVRTSRAFSEYVDGAWKDHAEALKPLAVYDGFAADRYPGFDPLFASLKTALSRDEVRAEIRRAFRRKVSESSETLFVSDLQADVQLQYALVQMLDATK